MPSLCDSIKINLNEVIWRDEKGGFCMKKYLCILLAGIMLIGLTACNRSPSTVQPGDGLNGTNPVISYSVYIPNNNADGFTVETITTEEISVDAVLAELKKRNVLPETVSINSFNRNNGLITIDFNQAFVDVICSMGTSGETMIVGSVVNTVLDAFHGELVFFTVDGQILESGHTVYDNNMAFFLFEQ